MAKVAATHSIRVGEKVYHNNDKCNERNNIETRYLAKGFGGKDLCKHCKKLNEDGK